MDNVVNSYIGRIVAFVLTPILLPVAAAVANWIQDVAGLSLDGGALAAYVVSVVAGVAIVAYRWLANRIEWEKAALIAEQIHDEGAAVVPPRV